MLRFTILKVNKISIFGMIGACPVSFRVFNLERCQARLRCQNLSSGISA